MLKIMLPVAFESLKTRAAQSKLRGVPRGGRASLAVSVTARSLRSCGVRKVGSGMS